MRFQINQRLLPMKLHYFLYNAGISPAQPYIPTLAKDYGYSSVAVGTVYTVLPIMGMLAKPIAGAISDRFRCQKALFLMAILISLVFFFAIPFVPALPSNAVGELHCAGDTDMKLTSSNVDECFSNNLAKQAPYSNSTFTCQLSCTADSELLEQICSNWHQTKYCAKVSDRPTTTIVNHITTEAAIKHLSTTTGAKLDLTPGTGLGPVQTKFKATGPQTVDFSALLYPYKAERMGQTVLIIMGNVSFDNGQTWVAPWCSTPETSSCSITCDNAIIADAFLNPTVSDNQLVGFYQFWLFVFILVMAWVGQALVVSLGDTICFEVLGDEPSKYGNQRLWGSVGWGIFSLLAGVLVDQFSKGSATKNYLPAFMMLLVLLILDLIVSTRLKCEQTKKSPGILQDVGKLLSDVRVVVYMLWCVVVGMCTAIVWNFLFWYLEELADAGGCEMKDWIKTLEGINSGMQCLVGEIPFFFLSGRILKKIGHINAMTLVLFAFGVRFMLYSVITNPWLSLPIELVHGLTFGLFYATMTSYASIVAPPGTETTIQGLVGAVFEGVGVSLGSFIGGIVMNWGGGQAMFRIFSYGAFACSIVHAIVQIFLSRKMPLVRFHDGDFKHRYVSPNDALHMLDDGARHLSRP